MAGSLSAVLFDLDGVLYSYDFEARLGLLADALGVPAETIRSNVFEGGIDGRHDLGDTGVETYIAEIGEALGVEVRLGQWLAARKWAMAPDPAMLDLARTLKSKVGVALLSNNGRFLADAVDEVAPELPTIFEDRLFFSGVHGLSKDFAPSFTGLLEKLGWDPATTLFVDDSETYIANADAAGLRTHLFDGIDGLRAALGEYGVRC